MYCFDSLFQEHDIIVLGNDDVININVDVQWLSFMVLNDLNRDCPLGVLEASSTSKDGYLLGLVNVESYSLNLKRALAFIVEEEMVGTERAQFMAESSALAICLSNGIVRLRSVCIPG